MIKLLLFISLAQAGTLSDWWGGFCERYLVADDPYQFEKAPTDWLLREEMRYQLLIVAESADRHDLAMLKIIQHELARRGE